MTTWITDDIAAATPFAGAAPEWQPLHEGDDPGLDLLARALNPGRASWVARAEDDAGWARNGPVVLIDQAGRSQFDALLECVQQGGVLPDRLVCLALTGARFRGQRSRPWAALRGNLHLTVRYALEDLPLEHQPAITMIPAVAAAETVRDMTGGRIRPSIKWVNDVFVLGCKVAGVLASTRLSERTVDAVIFGVGMNIDQAPEIQATPFVPAAGHLVRFEPELAGSLPRVFRMLVGKLDRLTTLLQEGGARAIFERYRGLAGFLGEKVCLWPEGTEHWDRQPPVMQGIVQDLRPDLSLVLDGVDKPVRYGRMAYASVWRDFVS